MTQIHWSELSFEQLVKTLVEKPFEGILLALDPGETTGWSIFQDQKLLASGQAVTKPIETGYDWLHKTFEQFRPTQVVFESYRVYSWKAQSHTFSDLHTSQFIGAIQVVCHQYQVPFFQQTAQIAKQFSTDEKLKLWGFYIKGQKHARDSLRHATYYQLHSHKKTIK